jgi:hypothetical protein
MTDAATLADPAEEIAHNAKQSADEPPRAVTFADLRSLFSMVAVLANIVAVQHAEIAELKSRKPAGRPPGSPNKK